MKALICVHCSDILAPHADPGRGWRWCGCGAAGIRWYGQVLAGRVEVTSRHGPDAVRVLGLANPFLLSAVQGKPYGDPQAISEEWRLLHDQVCEDIPSNYLFSERQRHCWAVVIRPGETGDVHYVEYVKVAVERSSLGTPDALAMRARTSDETARAIVARSAQAEPPPGSSGERAADS